MEELSHRLEDLRNSAESRNLAEMRVEYMDKPDAPKREPYVEYRENGKIKGLHYIKPTINKKKTGEVEYEEETWICDDLALVGEGKRKAGNITIFSNGKIEMKISHAPLLSPVKILAQIQAGRCSKHKA